MKKQPEQTARTRQAMLNAFWELALKQGLDRVTVSAVTKKADFNRGTFYVYFNDMDDLLVQAEEELLLDLQKRMKAVVFGGTDINYELASKKLVETLTLYDDKLFLLIGRNGDPDFLARVREEMSGVFREVFNAPDYPPYRDYVIAFITSAITGLLTYWHDTGKKIGIEELSGVIHGMMTRGVGMFLNEE